MVPLIQSMLYVDIVEQFSGCDLLPFFFYMIYIRKQKFYAHFCEYCIYDFEWLLSCIKYSGVEIPRKLRTLCTCVNLDN